MLGRYISSVCDSSKTIGWDFVKFRKCNEENFVEVLLKTQAMVNNHTQLKFREFHKNSKYKYLL